MKMLPHQCLDRSEVAIGEVFEAPLTIEEGFARCGEGFDYGHEVIVVVHEFQLNGSQMTRITCDGECGIGLIAGCLDQRLEAEALQSLRHGTTVPP